MDASKSFRRRAPPSETWTRISRCALENTPASKESPPAESRSCTSSSSRSPGRCETTLRRCANAPSSSLARIPSIPPRFQAARTASSRSNVFSWMLCRSSSSRQDFPHFVRVDSPQVISLQRRLDTIAMPLPERNARLILCCCFQQNCSNAAQRQVLLALCQQRRAHSLPPVRFRYIQRNHVRQRRIFLRQDKSHNLPGVLCHHSVCPWQLQKISQHGFGISDPRREARLVQPQQGSKVPWLMGTQRDRHGAIVG